MSAVNLPTRTTPDSAEVERLIREQFGYLAWAIDDEELGAILRQAVEEGWTPQTLQGALFSTKWWQSHSQSMRSWAALVGQDPAEAGRQIQSQAVTVRQQASQLGLNLSSGRAGQISETALRLGWSQNELMRALVAEVKYKPDGVGGLVGAMMKEVKAISADYLIPMADKTAFRWARRIVAGDDTPQGFGAYISNMAKGRFPHLADVIDRGISPGQYFAPYQSMAAQLLEISPGEVDFYSDSRFSSVLDPVGGGDGREERRAMTMSEYARQIRNLEDWQFTDQANHQASELGQKILETFGAVR
jgi:hypothetical protein